jgi:ssRNA-specific RNase YbeY (16S rRNA maturation enzyme)
MGYDHVDEAGARAMRALEEQALLMLALGLNAAPHFYGRDDHDRPGTL